MGHATLDRVIEPWRHPWIGSIDHGATRAWVRAGGAWWNGCGAVVRSPCWVVGMVDSPRRMLITCADYLCWVVSMVETPRPGINTHAVTLAQGRVTHAQTDASCVRSN